MYSLVTTSWRAERVLPPYIDHRQLHGPIQPVREPDLFGFIRRSLKRFVQHTECDNKAQEQRTISSIPEDRWVSSQMAVCVWLNVVLYSYAGNAARHGLITKKGKDNGLRDVTSFVVTRLPYPEWCLWLRSDIDCQPTSPTLPGGRQHRRDKGESERPHGPRT